MKNQITFKGGLALMAMSLIFLSSCKKEEITSKKAIGQSENQEVKKHEYKFSAVAKIPGEKPENGFLLLTVSSDDEAFMKKYVSTLEQTKIFMEEVTSTEENKENVHPLFDEQSNATVGLVFDWTNYSFEREKGKLYAFRLLKRSQSKSLTYYYSLSNQSSFNIGGTVAAVVLYNTYYRNFGSNVNNSTWYLENGAGNFYSKQLSYHDNLEVRCFQGNDPIFSNPYPGFASFVISGVRTYYRPRLNYSSPEMPIGYIDTDAITEGSGYTVDAPLSVASATLTFYIAG